MVKIFRGEPAQRVIVCLCQQFYLVTWRGWPSFIFRSCKMAEWSTLFPGQYLLSNYCIFMERFNPCLLQHLVLELNKKTSDEKILQPGGENGHFFLFKWRSLCISKSTTKLEYTYSNKHSSRKAILKRNSICITWKILVYLQPTLAFFVLHIIICTTWGPVYFEGCITFPLIFYFLPFEGKWTLRFLLCHYFDRT